MVIPLGTSALEVALYHTIEFMLTAVSIILCLVAIHDDVKNGNASKVST